MDIYELQKRIVAFRDERDWKQFHSPKELAIYISLEASELLEHFQFMDPKDSYNHAKNNTEMEHEFADVLNALLLFAHETGINIEKAQREKLIHT